MQKLFKINNSFIKNDLHSNPLIIISNKKRLPPMTAFHLTK